MSSTTLQWLGALPAEGQAGLHLQLARIAEVDGRLEPGHEPPIGVHGRGADRQQSRRVL